ncbi:uncharacterized protein LOC133825639 [Humulus lupulus]|uniref:uncharacterized protein LOC133825639 n=1 Tax=Humulus lupulus TaxID=3486 RepID=UPI002B409CCF|nr:uncharacterized protein LOC133825639 [Humulus lupulus]
MAGVQQDFVVTFVYGFNSIEGRRNLWEGWQRHALMDKAWLVLGDFNSPFSGKDKSGGKPISDVELVDSIRWLAGAHVEPLKSVGSYFTWTNNQNGAARIYSKIDHVLMNEKWIDLFPQSTAVFRWETILDHCSCLVSTQPLEKLGLKLFRFYNYWTEHHDFRALVLHSWRSPLRATGIKAIFLKLLRLKHRLKKFNRDKIGDLKLNYYKATEIYQEAQLQAQAYPHVFRYQEDERIAAEAFSVQERLYHSFLIQRSTITWLRQGDMNTSFFHAFLKKRKAEIGIVSFITEEGNLVYNFSEVVSHFVSHFRCFLGSPSSATGRINIQNVEMGSKLSVEQQLKLLKPFSKKEIQDSLFGDEVCAAITQCFETSYFPSELHETTLSLIPKVANPSRAVDYRPIAYCCTLYKCMAKLICKRLALVLPDLIQQNQGAFVKGRSIAHNIMIFQDLIKNYGRASTSSRCTIKIDLSKAYDTVDWRFLEDLLKALRFPMKLIGWVMSCIRNTSYSLLMNGRIQGKFKGEKGLRQGDPMSPLLSIKEVLEEFAAATGLSINSGKSHIFFGGVNSNERTRIAQEINLSEGNFPLKYLGVPMRPTKWRHVDCERSKLHIPSWQKVFLPKAYGGLGFRDGASWNRAFLAKYVWAISAKPDLLWVKWINSIYLKGANIWNYELKADCSWYWRKLCHLKDRFNPTAILSAGAQGNFQPSKLCNSLLDQQRVDYYQTIWSKLILPKHRFMLCQVVNSQLLTRDNLSKLHVHMNTLVCPVCESYPENHSHLFVDCILSKLLVNSIFDLLGFDVWPIDFNSWMVWLARARIGVTAAIVNMVVATVIYSIWKNRNKCFHDGYSLTVLNLVKEVKYTIKYRLYIVTNSQLSVKDQVYIQNLQCN